MVSRVVLKTCGRLMSDRYVSNSATLICPGSRIWPMPGIVAKIGISSAGQARIRFLQRFAAERQIACKLKRILGSLFRVDHQGLLGYRMAVPFGVWGVKPIESPPLAFGKTPRIISDLEQVHAEIEVCLGVVWLKLDGSLIVAIYYCINNATSMSIHKVVNNLALVWNFSGCCETLKSMPSAARLGLQNSDCGCHVNEHGARFVPAH